MLVTEAQRAMLALLSIRAGKSMSRLLGECIEALWDGEGVTRREAEELNLRGVALDGRRKKYDLDTAGMFYGPEHPTYTQRIHELASAPYTEADQSELCHLINTEKATQEQYDVFMERHKRREEAKRLAQHVPAQMPHPEQAAPPLRIEITGEFVPEPNAVETPARTVECAVCGESEELDENGVCAWTPQEWHREQEEAQKARAANPETSTCEAEICAGCPNCEGEEL